jgi:hypothetical protein
MFFNREWLPDVEDCMHKQPLGRQLVLAIVVKDKP